MEISQLNIRGRMAYGVACLTAYLNNCKIDLQPYQTIMDVLSQFTCATNLPQWDAQAKKVVFSLSREDFQQEIISNLLEPLYWVGASELYGQPSTCKKSEDILKNMIIFLQENNIEVPSLSAYSFCKLHCPISTDDFFGVPFSISEVL